MDVLDGPHEPIGAHFARVLAWVHAARTGGGCVLVHCHGGVSRAAALVLAYLMKSEGLGYEEALRQLRTSRPVVQPNPGFIQQLLAFEKEVNTLAAGDAAEWPQLGVPGSAPAPIQRLVERSVSAFAPSSDKMGPETPPLGSNELIAKLVREGSSPRGAELGRANANALKRSASL